MLAKDADALIARLPKDEKDRDAFLGERIAVVDAHMPSTIVGSAVACTPLDNGSERFVQFATDCQQWVDERRDERGQELQTIREDRVKECGRSSH